MLKQQAALTLDELLTKHHLNHGMKRLRSALSIKSADNTQVVKLPPIDEHKLPPALEAPQLIEIPPQTQEVVFTQETFSPDRALPVSSFKGRRSDERKLSTVVPPSSQPLSPFSPGKAVAWNIPHEKGSPSLHSVNNSQEINKKSILDTPNQNQARKGFVCIGDVISLVSKWKPSEGQKSEGVVSGDGIAQNQLWCMSKSKDGSQQIKFRQCLFRVEPARQYGFARRLTHFKDSYVMAKADIQKIMDEKKKKVQTTAVKVKRGAMRHDSIKILPTATNPTEKLDTDKDGAGEDQPTVTSSRSVGTMAELKEKVEQDKHDLVLKDKEERDGNQTELEISFGHLVTYGERIQLRHIHSDAFLTTSDKMANEPGTLKIELDLLGNEKSWFTVMPSNNMRQEGEPVRYADQFVLSSQFSRSQDIFLHMQVQQSVTKLELNASDNKTYWKAHRFTSYELFKNPEQVSIHDSFRIVHKQLEGHLWVQPRKIEQFLPKIQEVCHVDNEGDEGAEDFAMPTAEFGNRRKKKKRRGKHERRQKRSNTVFEQRPKFESNIDIFIEFGAKNSLSVWELQRQNPFIGGPVQYSENFRIIHVATGMYMSVTNSHSHEIQLVAQLPTGEENEKQTLFQAVPEADITGPVEFKEMFKIRSIYNGKFLKLKQDKDIRTATWINDDKSKPTNPIKIEMTDEKSKDIKTAFYFEDEAEALSAHIYQLSLILPNLIAFYEYLTTWNKLKNSKTGEWAYVYAQAKANEPILAERSQEAFEIVTNIRTKLLESEANAQGKKTRQNAIREAGLLDLLIKLAEIIEVNLRGANESTEIAPSRDKQKKKSLMPQLPSIFKAESKNAKQEKYSHISSADIAQRYLTNLNANIFKTVLACIKENIESCKILCKYDELFDIQVSSQNSIMKKILSETFKHSVDIFESLNPNQFQTWFSQLEPLNQETIDDQILVITILSSLCVYQNEGVPKYQGFLMTELFNETNDFTLIKFGTHAKKQYIEFLQGDVESKAYFRDNPWLGANVESWKEGTDIKYVHYVEKLTDKKIVEYVAAVLELLANMCLSRHKAAIEKVSNRLGLRFHHLHECIDNKDIPTKIRRGYLKLCRVIFVDRDPFTFLTEYKNRSYYWDTAQQWIEKQEKIVETDPIDSDRFKVQPGNTEEIVIWLRGVWTSETSPLHEDEENIKNYLKFTEELLILTKTILNLQHAVEYNFIASIYTALVRLIINYNKKDLPVLKEHWCTDLIKKAKLENVKGKFDQQLYSVIQEVLEIFRVAYHWREDLQVEKFLNCIGKIDIDCSPEYYQLQLDQAEIEIYEYTDFASSMEIRDETGNEVWQFEFSGPQNKVVPQHFDSFKEQRISSYVHGTDQLSLDVVLLELLFTRTSQTVDKLALELTLAKFNQKQNLRTQLLEVQLLKSEDVKKIYNNLFVARTKMRKDLSLMKIASVQNSINQTDHFGNFLITVNQASCYLDLSHPEQLQRIAQNIARNLSLHVLLLESLQFILVKDTNTGYNVVKEELKDIYNVVISTLYKFAYKNSINQEIIYQNAGAFEMFDKGVVQLLKEAVHSQAKKDDSDSIMSFIFSVVDEGDKLKTRHLDIIRSLVVDHSFTFNTNSQTNAYKQLILNKQILSFYVQKMEDTRFDWPDFTKYNDTDEKQCHFHAKFILLLASLSIYNQFVTLQLRRLIPYKKLQKEINREGISNEVKNSYQQYLLYVFMMDIDKEVKRKIELDRAPAMLQHLIEDLQRYVRYIGLLPSIVRKGKYQTVQRTQLINEKLVQLVTVTTKLRNSRPKLNTLIPFDTNLSNENVTKEELEAIDYWKYFDNNKPWKTRLGGGLLAFCKEFGIQVKESYSDTTGKLAFFINDMRHVLQCLYDDLEQKTEDCKDLDFAFLKQEILDSLLKVPYYVPAMDPFAYQQMEKQSFEKVVTEMCIYFEQNAVSTKKFFKKLDTNEDGEVNRAEFIKSVKSSLKSKVTTEVVDQAFQSLDSNADETVNFIEFKHRINKYFTEGKRKVIKVLDTEEGEDDTIEEKLKDFLDKKDLALLGTQGNLELDQLAKKVKEIVVNPAIKSKDMSQLEEFTRNCDMVFSAKQHRIYLFQMLRKLIALQEDVELIHNALQKNGITKMRQVLMSADPEVEYIKKNFTEEEILNVLNKSGIIEAHEIDTIAPTDDPSLALKQKNRTTTDRQDVRKKTGVTEIQDVLNKSRITELAVSMVNQNTDEQIVLEAVLLLNKLLSGNNVNVKETLSTFVRDSPDSYLLFSFIKNKLRESRERVLAENQTVTVKKQLTSMETKGPDSIAAAQGVDQTQLVLQLLIFVQLCCDYCYTTFQRQIREQTDVTGRVSIDLISEWVQYLIHLKGIDEVKNDDTEAGIIVEQCLKTLIDTVSGPNIDNQLALGKRRQLYRFINWLALDPQAGQMGEVTLKEEGIIMDKKYTEVNQYIRTLGEAVNLLKALLEGATVSKIEIPTIMMQQIDFIKLIGHATDIYKNLVYGREELVIQNNATLSNKWLVTMLTNLAQKGKQVTDKEQKIIEIGFDINILTMQLQELKPQTSILLKQAGKSQQNAQQPRFRSIQEETNGPEEGIEMEGLQPDVVQPMSFNAGLFGGLVLPGQSESGPVYEFEGQTEQASEDALIDQNTQEAGGTYEERERASVRIKEKILPKSVNRFCSQLKALCVKPPKEEVNYYKKAHSFYVRNISSVEINKEGTLMHIFFHKPSMTNFLTNRSEKNLIKKVKRTSQQEKIEDFFNKTTQYQAEMEHQQKLAKYPIIRNITSKWEFYAIISFTLVILMNLMVLFTASHEDGNTGDWTLQIGEVDPIIIINLVGAVQLVLAVLIYVWYIIEYYPVIIYKRLISTDLTDAEDFTGTRNSRIQGTYMMSELLKRKRRDKKINKVPSIIFKIYAILLDQHCVYHMIYLVLSIIGWVWVMSYSLLLIDIVKRFKELQNVVKAISNNRSQLLQTLGFMTIIILIYSIIAFRELQNYFVVDDDGSEWNTYCDTLFNWFTSVFNVGLRVGGGIGEGLGQALRDERNYWWRMVFDLTFFFIINVILLNIIFGIIIDAFAELRDVRIAEQKDINEVCLICGKNKFEFEVRRLEWNHHTTVEHYPFAYLAFIIFMKRRIIEDCNGAEKFVKEQILKNKVAFIPLTSISLLSYTDQENELQKKRQNDILQKLSKNNLTI